MADEGGLRIGTFAGAPVVIDPTILLLAAYVVGSAFLRGGIDDVAGAAAFVGVLMVAVLAHEFGHAGVAALLKIPSERIVLTFFGGYVKFASPPQKRWHEIAVSAAGPLVNLVCWAAALALAPALASSPLLLGLLGQFAYVSLILGALNLLPGFPLDGGHILRAFLSYFMSRPRAGLIAASVGLVLAAALIAYALSQMMIWSVLIGGLLALTAWSEIQRSRAALAAGDQTMSNA